MSHFNVTAFPNSSNILSHLATFKVNFSSSCRFFWTSCRGVMDDGLALDGQSILVAYTYFGLSSELI
jgi:hypothetical protein